MMIDDDMNVFILDMGLSRFIGQGAGLTQTGLLVGTPKYMSPEQIRGEKMLDTRCDIYSLGACLYHLISG